ncbi:MAG: hypothetical protein KC493_01890 [Bacteriovoracaceae bacterium]|nr:hypothetical protein [Bacteriovoracaceae bacterium]
MKTEIKNVVAPMVITILILLVLEVLATALLPVFGLKNFILPFNILVILFFGFRFQTAYLALFILMIQYFHSFFTVEGWEPGTIAGILVCILISYLRDLIHFSSAAATMIVTQIFQTFWFCVISGLIYIRMGDVSFVISKFWRFIPESIILSFLSPILFIVLEKVWSMSTGGLLGDEA